MTEGPRAGPAATRWALAGDRVGGHARTVERLIADGTDADGEAPLTDAYAVLLLARD